MRGQGFVQGCSAGDGKKYIPKDRHEDEGPYRQGLCDGLVTSKSS